jgi:hypothetical protein
VKDGTEKADPDASGRKAEAALRSGTDDDENDDEDGT